MKDLTDEFKLSARSTPEVFVILGQMVDRIKADRRLRFRGKKPTRAAIVNAALLYLDTLDPKAVDHALEVGLGRLETFLAEGEPAEGSAATVSVTPNPSPLPIDAESVPQPKPKTPAKRRVDLTVEDVSSAAPIEKPASGRKRRG